MNVKILVCHHKASPYIKNECFLPVQVGKEISNVTLDYCQPDNYGDNISEKNKSWCELTALYWAWKNLDADFYGLMHYRRLLNFKQEKSGYSIFHDITPDEVARYGWDPETIKNICGKYDIITAPTWNIHPVGLNHMIMTSYDFYAKEHYSKDMDVIIDIVKKEYPEYYFALLDSLSDRSCFFGNIAVMKSVYFHEYCSFLFGVLGKAEARIDISNYNPYQYRIWGFIAERLINCYVLYAQSKYENLKLTSMGLAFGSFDKPKFTGIPDNCQKTKLLSDDVVNVCMSFDDNYAAHADAAITSLIDNAHHEQRIDFYILCDDKLSTDERLKLQSNRQKQVSFHFIDIDSRIFSSLPLNRAYISLNTYYRLVIHKVLPGNVKKAIYIDSDVIVTGDIVELWNISLEDNYIAGALDEGGILQSRRLSLDNNNDYINAGVLVFNISKINEDFENVFMDYFENYYKYKNLITLQDQDILNITFSNKIQILPLKWNVNSRMFTYNELDHKYSTGLAEEAINDSGIIHYTDRKKPWKISCTHPLKGLYWAYRDKGNHPDLTKKEKFVKKMSGIFSYEIKADNVNLKLGKFNFTLNRRLTMYLYSRALWLTNKFN